MSFISVCCSCCNSGFKLLQLIFFPRINEWSIHISESSGNSGDWVGEGFVASIGNLEDGEGHEEFGTFAPFSFENWWGAAFEGTISSGWWISSLSSGSPASSTSSYGSAGSLGWCMG